VRGFFVAAGDVLRHAREQYLRHRTRRLGASLAYYSIFALVPTLFLALSIVALLFGRDTTESRIVDFVDDALGTEAAMQLDEAVTDLWENSNTSGFAIVTAIVVIYSASSLFIAWRDALEMIWEVPYQAGLKTTIRRRVFGALGPLVIGIIFAGVVLVEMLTAIAGDFITSPLLDAVLNTLRSLSPTAGSILILGLLYQRSARARPAWRDVWTATFAIAAALAVLAWGYGLYVRFFGSSSAAGVAGTLILGLAFIYYSAQLMLFGGEIISASAVRRGHPITPTTTDDDDSDGEIKDE
jgi:membrane protein